MSIQLITQFNPSRFFNMPSATGQGNQRLDTQVGGVAVSNDFSGRLNVTTAEGDTITLSADLMSDFRAVRSTSRIEGDGPAMDVKAKSVESSLTQEFGITVDGDLNEQEVKDLSSLFRKVANIFTKFMRGQDSAALANTVQLSDRFDHYSSLSDLSLTMDVERSVTIFAAALTGVVAGQPGATVVPPADQSLLPVADAPEVQALTLGPVPMADEAAPRSEAALTTASVPSSPSSLTAPTQDGAVTSEPRQPSPFVQQVLDALQDVSVEPAKLNKYFLRFLKDLGKLFRTGLLDGKQAERSQPQSVFGAPNHQAIHAYQLADQPEAALSTRT
ncbi:MAG: hypothetical protein OEV08_11720 [Nitrospira sp.]|nr:hypothetical protein [Nitrospira sp.]